MKFSFQTVWIIFGVTLVHLFAISALSPSGGARRDAISKADPAVSTEKKIQSAAAITDPADEPDLAVDAGHPEEIRREDPGEEKSPPTRMEDRPLPTGMPEVQSAAMDNGLVETGTGQKSPPAVDAPALSSPPQRIREIRDLQPVRRS